MTKPATPREPLNRDRIIDAAVRLVDLLGPEELSMRRLAGELGVEAMSLYNHMLNKSALLDGVTERVLDEMDVTLRAHSSWEDQIRQLSRAFRTVALAHPRAFPLVLTRQLGSPAALRPTEASLSVLHRAGFDRETAVHALRAFLAFQTGCLLRELGASPTFSSLSPEGVVARQKELNESGFPTLSASADLLSVCHHQAEFEFGTELFIQALRARRPGRALRP